MYKYVLFLASFVALLLSFAHAQQSAQVDSLLALHQYEDALRLIDAGDARSSADARFVIQTIQNIPALSDSVLTTRLVNASSLANDYNAENAEAKASSSYAEFLNLYAAGKYRSAYETFLLAQYFRVQHLKGERSRLRSNVAMTARYVKKEEFEQAEQLLDMYKKEKRTSAFITLEDTLRFAYNWLEPQIQQGRAKQEDVLGRIQIMKKGYITVGGGLNPRLELNKEQLPLREFENEEYATYDLPGNSISSIASVLCFEAGYYFSSHTSVGFSYARSSQEFRVAILANITVSYRARVEYTRADVLLVHRFSDKTGPRPYVIAGLGLTTSTLSPLDDSGSALILHVKNISSEGWHVVLGLGSEYIFSENLPFMVSGNGMMFLNSGNSDILKAWNLEFTLQLGVIL